MIQQLATYAPQGPGTNLCEGSTSTRSQRREVGSANPQNASSRRVLQRLARLPRSLRARSATTLGVMGWRDLRERRRRQNARVMGGGHSSNDAFSLYCSERWRITRDVLLVRSDTSALSAEARRLYHCH